MMAVAAFMGIREATSSGSAGPSAAVIATGGSSDAALTFDNGAALPYSPAKLKAAARGRASSLLLRTTSSLLIRTRKLPKVRLLLSAGFFIALLLIARQVAPHMGWYHYPSLSYSTPSRDGYTVLINTWKRNSLLKKAVAHYASCPRTDAIHVVWSEDDPPPENLKTYLRNIILSRSKNLDKPFFQFDLNEEDNLNNRFKPIEGIKTDAIFSVDDDVLVPCSTLEFSFSVWQTASDAMVGFVPRMHWLDEEKNGVIRYNYGGWWSVWWTGTYSMVLSKASFFHRKYLDIYTHKMPSTIRDYVTMERNCEDIAMSLLVANFTRAPPIWVKGKIDEIGSFGISSLGGHIEKRTKCLNDFISLYGADPLVPTSTKAVDAQEQWLW
ncbi:glycosyltransferase family protein 64 [Canna indica]|uniref:Glycosyltransferase family protein 64 n=1 Tax=Canna indica TaxID=4628 RepID=A0AAQ3JMW3_9LILI|nr:glycosyltransferase family protein 64 [Canna indica]